jgi:mRNA-degrading endonuclease toxin of MazEF toxin-antitoxin module
VDSVANVSEVVTLDREALLERVGKIGKAKLELIFSGLDTILDRRG